MEFNLDSRCSKVMLATGRAFGELPLQACLRRFFALLDKAFDRPAAKLYNDVYKSSGFVFFEWDGAEFAACRSAELIG